MAFWGITYEKEKSVDKDEELYGTYIEILPSTPPSEIVAIQDWAKEHPDLTYVRMPYAEIMEKASVEGAAYIAIDESGKVFFNNGPAPAWRKLTLHFGTKVAYYKVSPKTVMVLGKKYNVEQLEKLLSTIDPL